MSVRNVTARNKKPLDLFDPDTMDRIRKLKSRKKNIKRGGGFSDSQVENMYNLSTKIDNKRSSPKKNLCLVKKVDTPSRQSVQSTQILQKPQTVISRQDNSYYRPSSKVDNKKQGTEFRRVDQNYQLPLPPTLQARPTQVQPSYSSSQLQLSQTQLSKSQPLQPQTSQHLHSHSQQLLYNNLHTKNNTIQQYKKSTAKNGIQQIGGIARRKHSPKTVWRLVRRQQKKHISPKSIISNKSQPVNKKKKFSKTYSRQNNQVNKQSTQPKNQSRQKNNRPSKDIQQHRPNNNSKQVTRSTQQSTNIKKKMTKSRLLILDKKRDVQKRYKQRKTLRSRVKRWNREKILFYLARRGVVNLNTNAPQKLLKDLYLTCRAMGNIYIDHN